MYPSNTYVHTSFTDNDTNPNLGIQDFFSPSSSCFFHLPSPYIQYEDEAIYLQQLHDIVYQIDQDHVVDTNAETCTKNDQALVIKEHLCVGDQGTTTTTTNLGTVTKKMSKKDRHSKINTAHGPRDRRMRLSLDVARKFFGLQDSLGFDKASKTVEWLLKQSKTAIKELTRGLPHPRMDKSSSIVTVTASSTSDCEVMSSGIDDESVQKKKTTNKSVLPAASSCSYKEKRTRRVRKPTTFLPLAKESREKARERARERTKEKKKQQKLDDDDDDQQLINLMSWSPFGSGKESSNTIINYNNNPPSFEVPRILMPEIVQHQMQTLTSRELNNMGDSSNLFTGNWAPSSVFNYQDTSGTSHEQQSADFQFYGYSN